MIIDQGAQPCARKGCACEVPAGQTYCGPHCANASTQSAEAGQDRCTCGHSQCESVGAFAEGRATLA
jgi:hypothetical protein